VQPANFNSEGQVVISGDVAGVEQGMALAKEAGAKKCMPLKVSGAFHSTLMEPAAAPAPRPSRGRLPRSGLPGGVERDGRARDERG
jgi:malonyl CoA-acyl carrier protein transacylase